MERRNNKNKSETKRKENQSHQWTHIMLAQLTVSKSQSHVIWTITIRLYVTYYLIHIMSKQTNVHAIDHIWQFCVSFLWKRCFIASFSGHFCRLICMCARAVSTLNTCKITNNRWTGFRFGTVWWSENDDRDRFSYKRSLESLNQIIRKHYQLKCSGLKLNKNYQKWWAQEYTFFFSGKWKQRMLLFTSEIKPNRTFELNKSKSFIIFIVNEEKKTGWI